MSEDAADPIGEMIMMLRREHWHPTKTVPSLILHPKDLERGMNGVEPWATMIKYAYPVPQKCFCKDGKHGEE